MKLLLIFITIINLFAYTSNELKEIITSNSSKIDEVLHSKDGVYLLEEAILLNRMDILKKAKKAGVNLNQVDNEGNNLLMFASFLAKPKFVKYLIKEINPNLLNKRGVNSLGMVIAGINQNYPFVFYKNFTPKVKDKKSFEEYKKKLKQNIIKTTDILKKEGAKSEYIGNRAYSTFIFFRNYIEKNLRDKKPINKELTNFLLNHYFNDKQKMFLYFILGKDKKGKDILNKHIEFLKNPYYLDFNYHFLYLLAKIDKLEIAKYMINLAEKHNIDLVNYKITAIYAKNVNDLKYSKWAKEFWNYYAKFLKDGNETKVYKLLLDKEYKNLDNYTKSHFWQFIKFSDEIDKDIPFSKITPLVLAIYYQDKKAVEILLKNGGYMSGWNELHYKILKNKSLNLDKYQKWERVYKVNQGGLLDSITPITLSLMYNPKYIDELLKYTTQISEIDFHFAIKHNLEDKVLPYVKKVINNDLILLAKKKRFDIIKKLYKNGIIDDYDIRVIGKEIQKDKELLNIMLNAYLLKQCKENEPFLIYPKINNKSILKCLKAGYKFSDDTLVVLLQDGNKEIMKYLIKYKNHKLRDKYYPIFFITKKEFLDDFITPQSKSQKVVAECRITLNKDICKKAIEISLKLKNYDFAANLAIETNQTYLIKDYVDKLQAFKSCYFIVTDEKKAIEYYKKTKEWCPYFHFKGKKKFYEYVYSDKMLDAIDKNDTKTVLKYLNLGANPNAFYSKNENALFIAIANQNYKIVKSLVDKGADTLFKNKFGTNALLIASNSTPDILKLILDTPAKKYINYKADFGIVKPYPLDVAFFNKKYENVKILLKNGAKILDNKKLFEEKIKQYKLFELQKEFKKYKQL